MQALLTNAYEDRHKHFFAVVRVNVVLQVVQAPLGDEHAVQLAGHVVQTLFPGLYLPAAQINGFTHTPPAKASVELHPHMPCFGVFVVKVDLQAVQNPVLLQAVQFAGQRPQMLVPRLY